MIESSVKRESILRKIPKGIISNDSEVAGILVKISEGAEGAVNLLSKAISFNLLQQNSPYEDSEIANVQKAESNKKFFSKTDFYKEYLLNHSESWFTDLISMCDDNEIELLYKLFPYYYEFSGKTGGIKFILTAFLSNSAQKFIPVLVEDIYGKEWDIKESDRTLLGNRYSNLDENFVLGTRVKECSSHYKIEIGPISKTDYDILCNNGWIKDFYSGNKLDELINLISPFSKDYNLSVLIEEDAALNFLLGKAILGQSALYS